MPAPDMEGKVNTPMSWAHFEVDFENLLTKYCLEVDYRYRGSLIWPVYDKDGKLTTSYMVAFKESTK